MKKLIVFAAAVAAAWFAFTFIMKRGEQATELLSKKLNDLFQS